MNVDIFGVAWGRGQQVPHRPSPVRNDKELGWGTGTVEQFGDVGGVHVELRL